MPKIEDETNQQSGKNSVNTQHFPFVRSFVRSFVIPPAQLGTEAKSLPACLPAFDVILMEEILKKKKTKLIQ